MTEVIIVDLKETMWRVFEVDSTSSGWETVAGSCELGNETSGSVRDREFLDQLLKKDSASWH
jgi:hypothetical protein